MSKDWPDLTRTHAALEEFERVKREELSKQDDLSTEDLLKSFGKLDAVARKVKEAFVLDTADRNPRSSAMLVEPTDPWLRQLVQKWKESQE